MPPKWKTGEHVPPELSGFGAREVRLAAAGIALVIVAGVLFAGAWAVGLGLYLRATPEVESAVGEVRELAQGDVRYAYTVNGRTWFGRHRVPRAMARTVAVGSTIPIHYAVHDPGRSWIGAGPEIPVWLSPVLALLLAAVPAGIVYTLWREAALLMHGRAAVGHVVASKQIFKGGDSGAKTSYRLTVEFRILSGALRTARFEHRKFVPVGGSVVVVYDRDDAARSSLYPFKLVRAARPLPG